jgi:hypothetical protein
VTISFDPNILIGWYQAKAGLAGAAGAVQTAASAAAAAKIPTAPWNKPGQTPKDSTLVDSALGGDAFVNERAAKVDVANADADYKRLFAINQGLLTLQALANAAKDPTTSQFQLPGIKQAFARGLSEIASYVETTKFDEFRLTPGTPTSSQTSTAAFPGTGAGTYTTAVLATGSSADPVAAFQGTVQFDMAVRKPDGSTVTVNFDLAEMGATPRSMSGVAAYINGKLQAAGSAVRFSTVSSQSKAETVTVGGVTSTIRPAQTQWAFEITGATDAQLSFSAPATAPAIYLAQTAGDPELETTATTTSNGVTSTKTTTTDDTQQQFLKLEGAGAPDAMVRPNDANRAPGQVFAQALPDGVSAVRKTVTGSDGSVYMLADATGPVNGQGIKGAQDAVLLKYDPAGELVYTRTLGAGGSASGLALAVSATGQVAIAGSVTGELDAGYSGSDPALSDSFVTLYDASGEELWSARDGADQADTAQAVAFDAAGNVYVAGQTTGSIGGQASVGAKDSYVRAYNANGNVVATRQFGSTSDDSVGAMVVDGSTLYVAGKDGANGVVRSFDVTTPSQMALTGSRDLGSLGGGTIAGLGVDGSGNLLIGGSAGSALAVGNVTAARSAALDAFGARISATLGSTTSDAIAYYGGSGADTVTAATVANGQVWVAGTTKTDLPGLAAVGTQDGFVAGLDVAAGAVTYAQRFSGQDRMAAPESLAVDVSGASALDRLGLPKGAITVDSSPLVTSATAARAGDSFQIKVGSSSPTTVTIAADDTLTTLTQKIQRAGLFDIDVNAMFTGAGKTLNLKPDTSRVTFELLPGPTGRDALAALGLTPGIVRNTVLDPKKGIQPADKGTQIYGLRLPSDLTLSTPDAIEAALTAIGNAVTTTRAIYADLRQAANPQKPQVQAGAVPAYLQAQIADYTAALNRLTAGQDSGGGPTSLVSLLG